jgi:lipopolysaccharide transport system ATP-binding protein
MSQSDIAISVRNLSKAYTISHQANGLRGRRPTFRDTVTSFVSDPFRKTPKETFWALKEVSFDVKKGDVVGIIGRNGAGKSTLLKILSRITKPTSGEIDVYGRIGSLLEVGTGFHPELTGRENIFLNGAILGMSRAEVRKQFDAIVDFAEVEKFLDTPVKRFSSGMYVRLAFAVAAHLDPEVLVVDEVLAVGDRRFQEKCLGKLRDVSSSGRTVLFVSHSMASIRSLCNTAVFLDGGRADRTRDLENCVSLYMADQKKTRSSTILNGIKYNSANIVVRSVRINGSDSAFVKLTDERSLTVSVEGSLAEQCPLNVELKIKDLNGTVLLFGSPGHEAGYTAPTPKGNFSLDWHFELPEKMNAGEFRLSLDISSPGIEYWARMTDWVSLVIEGATTYSGRSLDYYREDGFIFLKSASCSVRKAVD